MGGDCRPLEEREGKICKAATIPTSTRAGTHPIPHLPCTLPLYHATSQLLAARCAPLEKPFSIISIITCQWQPGILEIIMEEHQVDMALAASGCSISNTSTVDPAISLPGNCALQTGHRHLEPVGYSSKERERDVAAHTHSRADYCSLCILLWLSSLDCVPWICTCSACVCSLPSLSLCAVVATLSPTPP